MKLCSIFMLLTFSLSAQLLVEWKQELSVPGKENSVTGLLNLGDAIIVTAKSDANSGFFNFESSGATFHSLIVPSARINCLLSTETNQNVYTLGTCEFAKRDLSGNLQSETCLEIETGWSLTTSAAAILNKRLYCAKADLVLKYDLEGNRLLRHSATSANEILLSVGGNLIYLYNNANTPYDGRLEQYDTLGNQKWSIAPGIVNNILADNEGNCYAFILQAQTSNLVNKYKWDGTLIWSTVVSGQAIGNGFLLSDSLFVCGIEAIDAANGQLQNSAFSILSAGSGEILYQKKLDLYPPNESAECFTQVASDGEAIYLGGQTMGENKKCFLVKLSKSGPTGLKESKANSQTNYSIFPNPGSNKFTLCTGTDVNSIHVTVRNVSGQVVQKEEIQCNNDKSWDLDLGKQPAGNYSVEIVSGNEKIVKRIIIE